MIVRTFAAGLLLTAFLMNHFALTAVRYFQYVMNAPVTAFWLALNTLSPSVDHITGAEYYYLAIYVLGCLGAGLAVAGVVYPFLESCFVAGLSFIPAVVQTRLPVRTPNINSGKNDGRLTGDAQ
jgi:hypothetical protein